MIQQAALYLATDDDVRAACLRVAGRPVAFRAIVAAVRAGARRVAVPVALRTPDLEAALATSPTARATLVWLDGEAALAPEPTLLLPAAALAPAPGLAGLLRQPPGRVLAESQPGDAPVLTVDPALLAVLRAPLIAGTPLGDLLGRELGTRRLASISSRWFVRVVAERDAIEAERRLWGDLGSPIDSRLDTAVHRRLSKGVTRVAIALGVGPNPITLASGVVGLAAVGFVAHGAVASLLIGLILYLAAVVLDHADGEVARLTLTESALGEWLDIAVDTVVHTALMLALGIAAHRSHHADARPDAGDAVGGDAQGEHERGVHDGVDGDVQPLAERHRRQAVAAGAGHRPRARAARPPHLARRLLRDAGDLHRVTAPGADVAPGADGDHRGRHPRILAGAGGAAGQARTGRRKTVLNPK